MSAMKGPKALQSSLRHNQHTKQHWVTTLIDSIPKSSNEGQESSSDDHVQLSNNTQ